MKKLRESVESWAAELLCRILVPRKDYDEIQMRSWRRVDAAERQRDRAVEELHEVLTQEYDRGYKVYERIAEETEFSPYRTIDIHDIDFPAMRYQFSLPPLRYKTLRDTEREHALIKRDVVERLTRHFRGHIEKHLFNMPQPNDN